MNQENAPAPAAPNRVRIFFNGFAVGVLLTGALAWYLVREADRHPDAQKRYQQVSQQATEAAGEALYLAGEALRARLATLDLQPEIVQEELARTGKIVRRRARELAAQISDSASDARITTTILAKLALDRDLSVWKISVTSNDGRVTFDGTVGAPEMIAKAVALAMEADGVRDVTANLKVSPKQP